MNLPKYKERYIGDQKIKDISSLEDSKTYLDEKRVEVEFEDGTVEEYPAAILEDIVTKKKSDPTELREKRVRPIVEEMLIAITEAELPLEDIDYAMNKLQWSISQNFDSLIEKVLGKKKERSSLYEWEQHINPKDPIKED